jgi:AcrR family transcriptional regulator
VAPLDGIRVLELCHFLAGPYAGLVLADLGADVLKVEDPAHPDDARSMGPHFQGDESLYFLALNSGKRSVGVRLASEGGRAVVEDLVRQTDVVIDNYRPGVLAKFGLDHDALHRINPAVVTCSLTGFGATGPDAQRAGYDYTIQALAGVMSLAGEPDGPPTKAGISGPALYHHFDSKEALLGEMLVRISEQLLAAGEDIRETVPPDGRLEALVAMHVEFAVDHRPLIAVQLRDLVNARETDRRRVHELQGAYVDIWVAALLQRRPSIGPRIARAALHSTFGLLNSTPISGHLRRDLMVELLERMALGALATVVDSPLGE